jgi:peptidoglycan/LPS O-acetylase OafA/YrhL
MDRIEKRRQGGLDGLRGIAALAVFGVHVWIYQLPSTVEVRRHNLGELLLFECRVAFVAFFVLSGYLLFRPFVRASLGAAPPAAIGSYLVRRAARIMPAYYVALAGTLLLIGMSGGVAGRAVSARDLPLFLVFSQNYTPETLLKLNAATWTLAVEMAFYLLLPLVALLGLKACFGNMRRHVALLAGLAAAGIAWNLVDFELGWGTVASHSAPSFLPYFACGMFVALLVERRRASGAGRLGARASVLLAVAAAGMVVANGYWHIEGDPAGFAMETFADFPAAAAFAAVIAAITLGTGTGVGWLGVRPLAWFGRISYGFYLWHIPLIVWARNRGLLTGGALVDLGVLFPAATALGAASWYVVERPLMRAAAKLGRNASQRGAPKPAPDVQRSHARTIALANPRP